MNPNVSQLDPKLKETYDRVMGFKVPNAPQAAQQPAAQAPAPQPQAQTPTPVTQPTIVNVAPEAMIKANQPAKKGLPPVAFAGLGLLFLAAYTFLWLKVFNVGF